MVYLDLDLISHDVLALVLIDLDRELHVEKTESKRLVIATQIVNVEKKLLEFMDRETMVSFVEQCRLEYYMKNLN